MERRDFLKGLLGFAVAGSVTDLAAFAVAPKPMRLVFEPGEPIIAHAAGFVSPFKPVKFFRAELDQLLDDWVEHAMPKLGLTEGQVERRYYWRDNCDYQNRVARCVRLFARRRVVLNVPSGSDPVWRPFREAWEQQQEAMYANT